MGSLNLSSLMMRGKVSQVTDGILGLRKEGVIRPRGGRGSRGLLTLSFSTKSTKAVRSISTGCPCLS